MIYRNKTEFINGLSAELLKYGVSEAQDILQDFEQHFSEGAAAGETEEQVCEKLGDPQEIAKQYIAEGEGEAVRTEQPQYQQQPQQYQQQYQQIPQQPAGASPDAGKVVGVILVDVLIFTWAIPALASLIMGLYSVATASGAAGIAVFIGGIAMSFDEVSEWFVSGFSALSTVLLGVVFMSLCGILVIASIKATIGFINVILKIINWHSRTFANKDVCTLIGKKNKKKEEAAE